MKLVLKMTIDEIKKRYGLDFCDGEDYIYCNGCPCDKGDGFICDDEFDDEFADGQEVCWKRIKEHTKTVTDIGSQCIKKMGWSL